MSESNWAKRNMHKIGHSLNCNIAVVLEKNSKSEKNTKIGQS